MVHICHGASDQIFKAPPDFLGRGFGTRLCNYLIKLYHETLLPVWLPRQHSCDHPDGSPDIPGGNGKSHEGPLQSN